MTSKERVLNAIDNRETDRMPMDYYGTGAMTARLLSDLNLPDERALLHRLGADIGRVGPVPKEGAPGEYYGHIFVEKLAEDRFRDNWGITWQKADIKDSDLFYDVVDFPLKDMTTAEEVDDYPWPDPAKDWDFTTIPEQIDRMGSLAVSSSTAAVFDDSWRMRGMENLFIDLAVSPDIARAILRRTCDYWLEYGRLVLEAGKGRIDLMWSADDLGTQNGLMISRDMCREFIMPLIKERVELFKSYGAIPCMHTCGSVVDVIPDIIETGVRVLDPVQPNAAGMDRERINTLFGDSLTFHGSIDLQTTLVFGTPDDVAAEVNRCRETLGRGGGYILSACHALETDVSTENVLALYRAGLSGLN